MYWSTPLQSGAPGGAGKIAGSSTSTRIVDAPTAAASRNIARLAPNGCVRYSIECTPIGDSSAAWASRVLSTQATTIASSDTRTQRRRRAGTPRTTTISPLLAGPPASGYDDDARP